MTSISEAVVEATRGVSAEGQDLNSAQRLQRFSQLITSNGLDSVEPLLPLLLSLKGEPYSLKDYFPFEPLFRLKLPKHEVLKTGRQVSKSTSLASHGVVMSNTIPNMITLFVTPLFEQIRRFSNDRVRPFIDESPVRNLWIDTRSTKNVLQRSFRNNSQMIFSYAYLNADRIRGISADKVAYDEIQDLDPRHIPIIQEVMSASPWGLSQYTGTPKSKDNTLEMTWGRSSQAEWFIKCHHGGCGHWNIPAYEYDLDAMTGPRRDDISEKYPGVVCAKCQKYLLPRTGRWVHRVPDRRWNFRGSHIPQIIMPLHYASSRKWSELIGKRENSPDNIFYNEVQGESWDTGSKLVTMTDLRNVANLGPNTVEHAQKRIKEYSFTVLAIDWGGGGEEWTSFTTMALLGYNGTKIDVIWGKRLLTPNEHIKEAAEIRYLSKLFQPTFVAHDYTGAGNVREAILLQTGAVQVKRIFPVVYVRGVSGPPVKFKEPTSEHPRHRYMVDKPRTLLTTCMMIKLGKLRMFDWDFKSDEDRGLIHDFLALVEEKVDSKRAGDVYNIYRVPHLPDDFAHAVNIGCVCIWHANRSWPNFNFPRVNLQDEQLAAHNAGWSDKGV